MQFPGAYLRSNLILCTEGDAQLQHSARPVDGDGGGVARLEPAQGLLQGAVALHRILPHLDDDILGLDAYHTSYSNFDLSAADVAFHAAEIAEGKGKLFAITETGLSNNNPGHYKYLHDSSWWTDRLYPLIKDIPVSYVMVWRNDGYPVDGGFPEYFNAFPGSYSTDDFLAFVGKEDILLESDLPNLYQ